MCSDPFKGQLMSKQTYAIINFPKIQRNIARIFALASKMGQIKKVRTHHTEIFDQNSFQIDSINSCSASKKLLFWLKIAKIIQFLTLQLIKGTLGFILKMLKKNANWRHKAEISKRNVKTTISPLLFCLKGWLGC